MKEKGITLIALVITIIILLILAGAAASIGLNGNNVFENANEAKSEWNEKVAEENTMLNNYSSYLVMEIPDEMKIGDTVNWTPTGHYTWDKSIYTTQDDGVATKTYKSGETGYTEDYEIATKELYSVASNDEKESLGLVNSWTNGDKLDFTISKWKVLSVDKVRKTVKIVPQEVTIPLTLQGASGYNNCVKLLNDACSNLYGENLYGVEVHNINMNDIESLLISEEAATVVATAKNTIPPYEGRHSTSFESYRNAAGEYTTNVSYPTIYAEEALRKIRNNDNTVNESIEGLDLSEAKSDFITRENAAVTKSTANEIVTKKVNTIHPAKTYYELSGDTNGNFRKALGESTAEVLLPDGAKTHYWVSSRCITLDTNRCSFCVRRVINGGLGICGVFGSSNYSYSCALGLFPVVSISAGTLNKENGEYTYSSTQ